MEFELREYLAPLRKWWWLIVITTLVAGFSSYLATRQQVPVYRSTATLMIGTAIDDPNPTSAQFSTTRQLAATYVDIAGRVSVRNAAAEALGLPFLWQEILVFSTHVLGACAVARAEYLITWLNPLYILADRFNASRDIESRNMVLWSWPPGDHAHKVRHAPHDEAVTCVEGSCLNAYQHVVIPDLRLVDFLEFEDIR